MENIFSKYGYIPYNRIKEITLLSTSDINKYNLTDKELSFSSDYWLKDSVANELERNFTVCTASNQIATAVYPVPTYYEREVRILLKFDYPATVGSTITCFGYDFTVISDGVAFCDNSIGLVAFDKLGHSDYDNSNIKKYIELTCKIEMEKRKYYLCIKSNYATYISEYSTKEALVNSSDFEMNYSEAQIYNAYTGQVITLKDE